MIPASKMDRAINSAATTVLFCFICSLSGVDGTDAITVGVAV